MLDGLLNRGIFLQTVVKIHNHLDSLERMKGKMQHGPQDEALPRPVRTEYEQGSGKAQGTLPR